MRAERKITLSIVAIGFLVVVGYFGFDYYMGTRLVRELCARDGGLRIYQTTRAEGFLDETVANALYCFSCFERLAKKQFEYVDIHVHGDPAIASPLAIQPGYYRLTLGQHGDPRCEQWAKNVNLAEWARLQRVVGISEQQCVAVEPLPDLPIGPELSEVREKIPNERSVDVRVDRWTIRHTSTRKTLAEYRNYLFYAHWDRIFNFAGGDVPEPAAMCADVMTIVDGINALSQRTLRTSMNQIPKTND